MIFNFLFRPELLRTEATGQSRRLPFGGSILLLHETTGIHDGHGKSRGEVESYVPTIK